MYVSLLLGSIAAALVYGALLADFTPGRLIQVIQGTAVVTMLLNGIAVWKQEPRSQRNARRTAAPTQASGNLVGFHLRQQRPTRLAAVGLGTLAFAMQDVMLEPYGGQVLACRERYDQAHGRHGWRLPVGFSLASHILGKGYDPFRMAAWGAMVGVPAFALVMAAAPLYAPLVFGLGTLLIGFAAGLFGHGTLTATMNSAPPEQRGLALGAWGAVQATAAGLGVASGGVIRDAVIAVMPSESPSAVTPYMAVYALEILLLLIAIAVMFTLMRSPSASTPPNPKLSNPIPAQKEMP